MSETPLNRAEQRALRKITRLLGVDLAHTARAVILAIGGVKGGIGKSTTALFLAYCWALLGIKVLVIDADPKSGTSRKWNRRAKSEGRGGLPFTVKTHVSEDLEDAILDEGWDQEFDLIIIDTGGDNDRILRAAYRIADRMILTASPSPVDIDTLPDTAETTVGELGERDIPVSILITSAKSDRMVKDAKKELRAVGLSVLTSVVKHRLPYQQMYGWPIESGLDYVAVQHELDNPKENSA
ncbi:ParA family protein [Streptomyces sp. NPDC051907]|uniref:ParA family protein n=1 Tax=Streptomyces sp. NPDC051907 TaxID=3155284 RepID=UPI00344A2FE8